MVFMVRWLLLYLKTTLQSKMTAAEVRVRYSGFNGSNDTFSFKKSFAALSYIRRTSLWKDFDNQQFLLFFMFFFHAMAV